MVVVRFVMPRDRPHLRASKFERQLASLYLLGIRSHGSPQWPILPLWGKAGPALCPAENGGVAFSRMRNQGCEVPMHPKR